MMCNEKIADRTKLGKLKNQQEAPPDRAIMMMNALAINQKYIVFVRIRGGGIRC